jgi:hypothetical protein
MNQCILAVSSLVGNLGIAESSFVCCKGSAHHGMGYSLYANDLLVIILFVASVIGEIVNPFGLLALTEHTDLTGVIGGAVTDQPEFVVAYGISALVINVIFAFTFSLFFALDASARLSALWRTTFVICWILLVAYMANILSLAVGDARKYNFSFLVEATFSLVLVLSVILAFLLYQWLSYRKRKREPIRLG